MKRVVDLPIKGDLPFSTAVVASGLCFVAGQFGIDGENKPVGDVEEQAGIALDRLGTVLKAAGTSLDQVVRITCWLLSFDDFPAVNRAYRIRFPKAFPARVTVVVNELLFGARVEFDAIAAMPDV